MHWQEQDRWEEIRFYLLCKKIFEDTNKDMRVINQLIEGLSILGDYNPTVVKQAAYQILSDMRYKPSKREIVLLSQKTKVPILKLIDLLKIGKTLYYAYKKEEDMLYMSRLPKYKLDQVKNFLKAYEIVKGALPI